MLDLDEILQYVSPTPEYKFKHRPSFIIIGKSGCGKSTLATKLSAKTASKVLSFDKLLLEQLELERTMTPKMPDEESVSILLQLARKETSGWR
jgi:ABC-type lipoprotein export system ATPase subunit